jgi:hypothetical protein
MAQFVQATVCRLAAFKQCTVTGMVFVLVGLPHLRVFGIPKANRILKERSCVDEPRPMWPAFQALVIANGETLGGSKEKGRRVNKLGGTIYDPASWHSLAV